MTRRPADDELRATAPRPSHHDQEDRVTDRARQAALVVAGHAHDLDDARQLLDALGLLDPPADAPRPRRPPRALQPCGTRAAYVRHRARGEQPCQACVDAWRAYARDAARRYREADPDAFRAGRRAYYQANRDREIARAAAWRIAHPDRYREVNRQSRARRRAAAKATKETP